MQIDDIHRESVSFKNTTLHIIKNDSGKVLVFVDSPRFTFIPSVYYTNELREQYFRLAHNPEDHEIILENSAIKGNYTILFSINQLLKSEMESRFPDADFFHVASALSSRITATEKDNPIVLINKQKDHFYLVISKNNEIVLLNSYRVIHNNDICYYVLNGLRETAVNPSFAIIWYSGMIQEGDDVLTILRKYSPKVESLPALKPGTDYDPLCIYFSFHQTDRNLENN